MQSIVHTVSMRKINREALAITEQVLNPYNAEATYIQSTKTQKFLKTTQTLSYWYSFNSSHWALLDEYPFVRVSVIFQYVCIILCWQN